MKLSEMSLKEFSVKSAKLLPILKTLAKDKEILGIMYKKVKLKKGATEAQVKMAMTEYNIDKYTDLMTLILEKHMTTVCSIFAILHDCTVAEVEEWSFGQFTDAVAEILGDEGFAKLFTLAHK